MALLSEADRDEVAAQFMRETSNLLEEFGAITKQDIRAAVAGLDDWRQANAAEANAALPQPFRGEATAEQKSRMLTLILAKAYHNDMNPPEV